MLPSPRFSVASALVPHLCFLSLLCYVRYLCYVCILLAPFHCPFSICSNFSLYSVFSQISLFPLILPCVLKRFPLTISRKMNTTCAKNVLTRTPGDTEHDVLPLTPTPEFPPQDKPRHRPGAHFKILEKVYSTPCEKSRKGVYLLLSKL